MLYKIFYNEVIYMKFPQRKDTKEDGEINNVYKYVGSAVLNEKNLPKGE